MLKVEKMYYKVCLLLKMLMANVNYKNYFSLATCCNYVRPNSLLYKHCNETVLLEIKKSKQFKPSNKKCTYCSKFYNNLN